MDADFDRQLADLLAEAPECVNIETICANWTKMRQALEAGDRIEYEPLKSFFETVELTLSVERGFCTLIGRGTLLRIHL